MKTVIRKIAKTGLFAVLGVLVLAVGLVVFLTITEYCPQDIEQAEQTEGTAAVLQKKRLKILSWNTGYSALGENADFFMDGGQSVRPTSKEQVLENLEAILSVLEAEQADALLLQEVDVNSKRSYGINQWQRYQQMKQMDGAYVPNYRCQYVPFPWPTIGKVESGLVTLTQMQMESAYRSSLPVPFSWPVRAANLKRCLLVSYLPLADSDKQLVVINLHLEAYDDGEGKKAQTQQFWELAQSEYEKGNYVIAGGDFNQVFPETLERYPIAEPEKWLPGTLESTQLPEGWQYAWDAAVPTCRLLDAPYDPEQTQHYVIDGFIISPNVKLERVQTLDLGFANSDHNPVRLEVTLQ